MQKSIRTLSEETKEKIRKSRLGRRWSEEVKNKMRKPHPSMIGNQNAKGNKPNITAFTSETTKGKNNTNWKGDGVGYGALHSWIKRNFGRPDKCEECGSDNVKSYYGHWHNLNKKYNRDRMDWMFICAKCHRRTISRR